jgi:CBS domain containing-hemolysin-like protein
MTQSPLKQDEEPSVAPPINIEPEKPADRYTPGLFAWLRNFLKPDGEASLRETIDEYISEAESEEKDSAGQQERLLLMNILRLRDLTVVHVMIPRADIIAIDLETTQEELLALLAEKQYSRIPVYRGTLDDVLGTIHIKDVLAALARGDKIDIRNLIKEIPIVSPALPVMDLLLLMRETRRHMALVVDEFGGIDGLVTVNDVLDMIVGHIGVEHDNANAPLIVQKSDGSILVDARLAVDDFEKRFGEVLTDDERATADTLNGLIFTMEARIPGRGEIITHSSGMVFEIMDADPRRINLLKISNIPQNNLAAT